MEFSQYLAMTAAEMGNATHLPEKLAWMACHFSPYSRGLCNLPVALPEGSLLILNDSTPMRGHNMERVCQELGSILLQFHCAGLLIDFQNPPEEDSASLAAFLVRNLRCPVGVPPAYAAAGGAVFLPPVPTDVPLEKYLKKWAGRTIWLESALEGQTISLTPAGASYAPNHHPCPASAHVDRALHCHYQIQQIQDAAIFRTWRTGEDLAALTEDARALGVALTVGLFQELGNQPGEKGLSQDSSPSAM